jgi:exosortase/archaeosortase family protein
VVVAISIAYHYSLLTLARGLGLQTPLAYLSLVPVIALGLAWVALRREPAPLPIHDRQLDYIVGVGLMSLALAIAFLLPDALTTRFWIYRVDLVGLPVFAAGVISLFYGLRSLWALRYPIVFLFLAWPAPYLPLVGEGIRAFVDATSAALTLIAHVIPIVEPVPGEDTYFFIHHGQEYFPMSVSSACSGVNGLVGFMLIGGALVYLVDGPLLRRTAWLLSGLLLVWSLNIVRIELIFIVAALFGERTAIDILHPVAGLIVFNLGVLGMLSAVPRFGLRFMQFGDARVSPDQWTAPVRRMRGAAGVSVAVVVLLAGVNNGYARFEPLSSNPGQARLAPFDVRTARAPLWESSLVATYEEGKAYFGVDSTWQRMLYSSTPAASLRSSVPIYVDAIDTPDANALAAYGIEACYQFHGFRIESTTRVDIGGGVTAQVIDYHSPRDLVDWTALWWEWPVRANGALLYQRVVLFVANGPRAKYVGSADDVPPADVERFTLTNRFLSALARQLVADHIQTVPAS